MNTANASKTGHRPRSPSVPLPGAAGARGSCHEPIVEQIKLEHSCGLAVSQKRADIHFNLQLVASIRVYRVTAFLRLRDRAHRALRSP